MDSIKNLWTLLTTLYGSKDDIKNPEDRSKVQSWMKQVKKLHITASLLALLFSSALELLIFSFTDLFIPLEIIISILISAINIYISWGFAAMYMNYKQVTEDVFKAAVLGYKVGSEFESTSYTVTNDYANHYRISSTTTNDGCLYALIFGFASYLVWGIFCMYLAPFLTFKKYRANAQSLMEGAEQV